MNNRHSVSLYSSIAHAKINLALHVTGQRIDGYHQLDSLVCFTDIGDRLEIAVTESPGPLVKLDIVGEFASNLDPSGDGDIGDNLVVRAALGLERKLRHQGISCSAIQVTLEKNLPVASGIGGGSADAAAALVLLTKLWAGDSEVNITDIALDLGADVAMCLDEQPKRIQGIGEKISDFRIPVSLPILLVNPGIPLATPRVFGALGDKFQRPINMPDPRKRATDFASVNHVVEFLSPLRNDLQIPAVCLAPEIEQVLAQIKRQPGCLLARMSGSGATCFGIFDSKIQASSAMIQIKEKHNRWWSVACNTIPASNLAPKRQTDYG